MTDQAEVVVKLVLRQVMVEVGVLRVAARKMEYKMPITMVQTPIMQAAGVAEVTQMAAAEALPEAKAEVAEEGAVDGLVFHP
jgi:hypothetical protein